MKGAAAIRPKYATLTDMLAGAAQSQESLFFVDRKEQDQEVPMARVRERAQSIAADLVARGVRKGDRVALVLPTCPEFVECLFGVVCAGAIPVPLYPPVRLGKTRGIPREDGRHAARGGRGTGCDRRTHPPVPRRRG